MALLNTFTDSRTLAGVASGGNVTYAHGLTVVPDEVRVFANASTTATLAPYALAWAFDSANVTIWNNGGSSTPALKAIAQAIHSIQR